MKYAIYILTCFNTEIEEEFKMEKRLKNLDEMANFIDYQGITLCKWLMMICGVGIMFASTVTNIFIIGKFFVIKRATSKRPLDSIISGSV